MATMPPFRSSEKMGFSSLSATTPECQSPVCYDPGLLRPRFAATPVCCDPWMPDYPPNRRNVQTAQDGAILAPPGPLTVYTIFNTNSNENGVNFRNLFGHR